MQLRHEAPHLRGLDRVEPRPAGQREQRAERAAVIAVGRGRKPALMPERVKVLLHQACVGVRGSRLNRHAARHYSLDASAPATSSPMRRRNSVPISA